MLTAITVITYLCVGGIFTGIVFSQTDHDHPKLIDDPLDIFDFCIMMVFWPIMFFLLIGAYIVFGTNPHTRRF